MFKRILVAFDGSAESERALTMAIQLAKSLNADLSAVYVYEKLPSYVAGYTDAGVTGASLMLAEDASQYYQKLKATAQQNALQEGIALKTELLEGNEVSAIVEYVKRTQSDLLVVGISRHDGLLRRLWNHTAHDLAQRVSSSILGVH